MSTRIIRAISAACICLASGAGGSASFEVGPVSQTAPGIVSVSVNLPDAAGADASAFELVVEGAPVIPAAAVKRLEAPQRDAFVVLCIDRSGSVGAALRQVREALADSLARPHPNIQIALVAFGNGTKTLQDFGVAPGPLVQAAKGLKAESADGKTKLYEAIAGALGQLKVVQTTGTKRIIVVSDGKDEGSIVPLDRIIDEAKASSVSIDGIGVGRFAQKHAGSLESMAASTQGTFHLSKAGGPPLLEHFQRLLSQLLAGPSHSVSFKYEVASDAGRAELATLRFKSPSGVLEQVIHASLAKPKPRAAAQPDERSRSPSSWDISSWLRRYWDVLISGGGVLLAFVAWRMRRKTNSTETATPDATDATSSEHSVGERPTLMSYVFPQPEAGQPAATLVGRSGVAKGVAYPIDKVMFRIGASASNDVRLSGDDFVSGEHACIRYDSGTLYLIDQRSRNGTLLNDTRLTQAAMPLRPGDRIRIGGSTLELTTAHGNAARVAQDTAAN
jgi:hypothetical protein